MTDEVVTRLYRCLVDELDRRGIPEGRPVKVSELYQTLVPYRSVRSALGVELNADYEHALLRLLAGERELLRLEPAQAREELRREVDAPYPFVGLFRKFSASNVWISRPESVAGTTADGAAGESDVADTPADDGGAMSSETEPPARRSHDEGDSSPPPAQPADAPDREVPQSAPADEPPGKMAAEADTVPLPGRGGGSLAPARRPVQLHRDPERADAASEEAIRGGPCTFCEEVLPDGRRIRFCPYCGADQRLQPCPRCDAVMERGWRFCISCGHDATAP